jgi:predicted P-loop ATPase
VATVQEFLQHAGLTKLGKDTVHQAVDARAHERTYHPVRDYLSGLEWDGQQRAHKLFSAYFGADPSPYTGAVSEMFLVALAARIFQPGCKADYMPVIEGDQGLEKSKAIRILGGEWFSDSLPDVTSGKDVCIHLQGKWPIEIAEMSAMTKAETSALKAFITRQEERFRPPYGRKEVIQPRQCLFIGTTNAATYLKDPTGARRFWPIKAGRPDIGALIRDRDQLFAEAVHLYRAGHRWWPSIEFEREHILPQQELRHNPDVWEEFISEWLQKHRPDRVLVGAIARECLGFETTARIGRQDQNRIVDILQRLGWRRLPTKIGGNVFWGPPA